MCSAMEDSRLYQTEMLVITLPSLQRRVIVALELYLCPLQIGEGDGENEKVLGVCVESIRRN